MYATATLRVQVRTDVVKEGFENWQGVGLAANPPRAGRIREFLGSVDVNSFCLVFLVSPKLLEILRATLREVERTLDLPPDDRSLRELKQGILLGIGELEMRRTGGGSRVRILWINPAIMSSRSAAAARMSEVTTDSSAE